jgi:hypothetical protein
LDATPYELYIVESSGVRGKWTNNAGKPSQQAYTGMLNDRLLRTRTRFKELGREVNGNFSDVARLRAMSKMNNKDVDLGTAFAEAGKTAQLVGDIAHFSVNVLRALYKRDLPAFRRAFESDVSHSLPKGQSVVDGYLAYHYGVKPMLQEVAGLTQAITRLPPEQWAIRSKGSYANEATKSQSGIGFGSSHISYTTKLRESNRTVMTAVRLPITRYQDVLWSLGLDDPLSTAWELTPFSFVYDWLMPVGDWLASINASKYYTNWSIVSTDYIREETFAKGDKGWVPISGMTYESQVKGFVKTLYIKRSAAAGYPFTTLPIKNPFSFDHAAKGLSLLATTLSRGGEPPRFLRY